MLRLSLLVSVACCLSLLPASGAGKISAGFFNSYISPPRAGSEETVVLTVRSDISETLTISLTVPQGVDVIPASRNVTTRPNQSVYAVFRLKYSEAIPSGTRICANTGSTKLASLTVVGCYNLEAAKWKTRFDTGAAEKDGWTKPEYNDSAWADGAIPSMTNEQGVTYWRTHIHISQDWKGRDIYLSFKAIDDNDACYLNGVKIGETFGWDIERKYKVDPKAIRYGEDNLLCVAVNNGTAGGGIYKSPSYIGFEPPHETLAPKPKLAKAAPVGKPLPLRKMKVKNGVLLYEDGSEVALWGVNYYPQSWYQFDNMRRLGIDMKKAVQDDLDDMKKMGVELIRIHVFDREISDHAGNLIDNEHLDLLDYLISEASKRGIYFMFTPIAWWGGPNENKDSFCARTPMEFMFCDDAAIRAQANYIKYWLNHINRYSKLAYKDEPAICAFEFINEPSYVSHYYMMDAKASYNGMNPELVAPFKKQLHEKWIKWCSQNGIEPEARFFPIFRYTLVSRYLDIMHSAFREARAQQPVASALCQAYGQDDLIQAIADSKCEAVTTGLYAGAWNQPGDQINYLPYTDNTSLDARLDKKARFVYEFDGIKTFGSYFYPACARRFRNLGVQLCAMFQYDSSTTAEWNTDWDAHYLNWLYTPGKSVSFFTGGQAFHDLPRGAVFPTAGTTQAFDKCAVSFDRNISIYSNKNTYACSAPYKDWKPVKAPEKPKFVMAMGNSPFAEYDGTGIYTLSIDYAKRQAILDVNPDVEVVGDPWNPNPNKSAVVLKKSTHQFGVRIPGVTVKSVRSKEKNVLPVKNNAFKVEEGIYTINW